MIPIILFLASLLCAFGTYKAINLIIDFENFRVIFINILVTIILAICTVIFFVVGLNSI